MTVTVILLGLKEREKGRQGRRGGKREGLRGRERERKRERSESSITAQSRRHDHPDSVPDFRTAVLPGPPQKEPCGQFQESAIGIRKVMSVGMRCSFNPKTKHSTHTHDGAGT